MITTLINSVVEYLRHDSTWLGLIGVATAAGVHLEPAQSSAIVAVGLALAGLFQVFIVDRNVSK